MRDRRPTLIELEAFRTVVAEGTTAAAARRLGRAQSSVSRTIAELERRVGYRLFERRGRLIEPTFDALSLNRELDPLFEALENLTGREPQRSRSKVLAVAASPAFGVSFVPRAFAAFRAKHQGCRLNLEVASTSDVIRMVSEGNADIGLTDSTVTADNVRLEPFRQSSLVCLMPATHKLAGQEPIALSDLSGEMFVALARRHSMRAHLEALLRVAGVDYAIAAETSTAIAAVTLIRNGVGIGLLNPFPLLSYSVLDGLTVRPVIDAPTYRTAVVLPAHTPPAPLAKSFQHHLLRFVRKDRRSLPC